MGIILVNEKGKVKFLNKEMRQNMPPQLNLNASLAPINNNLESKLSEESAAPLDGLDAISEPNEGGVTLRAALERTPAQSADDQGQAYRMRCRENNRVFEVKT